jgi:ApaG protein
MVSKISEGVEISVETFYQADYSNPLNSEYMFAYRITIENHNNFTVNYYAANGTFSIVMVSTVK